MNLLLWSSCLAQDHDKLYQKMSCYIIVFSNGSFGKLKRLTQHTVIHVENLINRQKLDYNSYRSCHFFYSFCVCNEIASVFDWIKTGNNLLWKKYVCFFITSPTGKKTNTCLTTELQEHVYHWYANNLSICHMVSATAVQAFGENS